MPVTMKDVAEQAGVSIRTVSRVVNNLGEISDETRQRVKIVIDNLGYQPNAVARGLVSGKTATIGIVIPQITDPFFPQFVLGVESIANQEGYSVFLCNTNEDVETELQHIDTLTSKRVDGIILAGGRLSAQQITKVAQTHNIVAVTSRSPKSTATVNILGKEGLYEITAHLIKLGHSKISHIGWRAPDENTRVDGYEQALLEHGLQIDEQMVVYAEYLHIESGKQAALQLLQQSPKTTAITCYNDLIAIGSIQACHELGWRVPEDVAIVGFDDIRLASLVTPALTTMHVPRHDVGEMAARLLFEVMGSEEAIQKNLTVKPTLTIRESCGAKSKGDRED